MLVKKSSQNAPKNKLCLAIASLLGRYNRIMIQLKIEDNVCQPIFDQPL